MSVTAWKLVRDIETGKTNTVWRKWDNGREESMFVSTPEVQDYLKNGAELQDADGNVMSPEVAQQFIATLP